MGQQLSDAEYVRYTQYPNARFDPSTIFMSKNNFR